MAYEVEIYILKKQVTKLICDMPELVYQKIYYKIQYLNVMVHWK